MTPKHQIKSYVFDELFYPLEKGTAKLTEYAIYQSLDCQGELVPLWGGNQEHDTVNQFVSVNAKNKDNKPIKIFDGECLIVSLDGSAGSMTYKPGGEKFALNHHAGVLRCKNPLELDLEYYKFKYENFLKGIAVSDGSKTLSKKLLEKQIFEITDIDSQKKEKDYYSQLIKIKKKVIALAKKTEALLEKNITLVESTQGQIPLNKVFSYISRNDLLSEEGIYKNSSFDDTERIKVLSGRSEKIKYGEVPVNTPKIHFLENRQGLHLITRGNAGRLTYLPIGRYATNTNAFILYLQNEQFEKLNIKDSKDEEYYLKFMKLYLEPKFIKSTSFADVAVFPLTELMGTMVVPIFKLSNSIRDIVDKYDKVLKVQNHYKKILKKIDTLLSKDLQ